MALTKTVNIDGKDVTFRASAAIPRIYRNKFHRDIYKDLHDLQKGIDENDPENSALDSFRWSFLRISATSWRSTQIRRVYLIRRMSGLISSGHSPFIRCFQRSSSFGG